jgi:hypothetical protein
MIDTIELSHYISGVGPACLPYTFNGVSFVGNDLTAVGWVRLLFLGSVL